ncbi:MAG: hypothetical protein HKN91_01170 [Acidimicrobiia bacterium]|nr:hypothetical protein [Acidimicrobiia bacterium]
MPRPAVSGIRYPVSRRYWVRAFAVAVFGAVLVGYGAADDEVDSPFFRSAELVPVTCDADAPAAECFELVTIVFDHPGSVDASCRVYALADDGATDLGEVARFDGLRIQSEDSPRFDVLIADPRPEGFLRWQPECHPGPPG